MRIAIILYCLLSAIINVSAAENVNPGKYLCVVSDAVGLLTNASTHQRYGGAIALPQRGKSSSSPSRKRSHWSRIRTTALATTQSKL